MKIGAVDYIRKPFTPDQLTELVEKVMDDRKARMENVIVKIPLPKSKMLLLRP